MKWTKKIKPQLKDGDVRDVTKFLWLPKTIDDTTVWLEVATYRQEYVQGCEYFADYWRDCRWVDNTGSVLK